MYMRATIKCVPRHKNQLFTVQSAWPPLTTMPLRTALTPLYPPTMLSYKPIPLVCTWILVLIQIVFETIWEPRQLLLST